MNGIGIREEDSGMDSRVQYLGWNPGLTLCLGCELGEIM